jgi:hypothetical protein
LSSLSDRIAALKARAAQVTSQLTSLSDKRRSYSLAASEGDAKAQKSIGDIDFETDALKREQATVADAIEIGEALEQQRLLDAEAEQQHSRQVEAHEHAQAVATLNAELDGMLVQLRECLERRAIHLRSLSNTGVVDSNLIMRLSNKAGPTSAAHHAGLGRYINLDMVPVVAHRPLADANSLLLGIGEPSTGNGKSNGGLVVRPTNKRATQ